VWGRKIARGLKIRTYNGCRDPIPYFEASKPVIKGNAAEPAIPIPLTSPMQAVSSQRGRMCVICCTRSGNIGPSTRPTKEIWRRFVSESRKKYKGDHTATALPTMEGTNQTVSSRLKRKMNKWDAWYKLRYVRDGDYWIHKNNSVLTHHFIEPHQANSSQCESWTSSDI